MDSITPWHIFPVDEEELHDFVGSRCRCIPDVFVDADGCVIVSHNSFNGREWYEPQNVRLN